MESLRKPFQGVGNIIRFNWHFYALATVAIGLLLIGHTLVGQPYALYLTVLTAGIAASVGLSLLTSFYIYDLSGLYTLSWLHFLSTDEPQEIVTINAGFDETSALLARRFPHAHLHVFDFYDPAVHTEVSIKRARKAYPAYPGTRAIRPSAIPLADGVADVVFLILAAHEIRGQAGRIHFFRELRRVLKPSGQIIVVEHLRDGINFLAYTIGFLHFMPLSAWITTFEKAALVIRRRQKLTPFITLFVLEKDGTAP